MADPRLHYVLFNDTDREHSKHYGPLPLIAAGKGETTGSVQISDPAETAVDVNAMYIRVYADVACHVHFASSPAAVNTAGSEVGWKLGAGESKEFRLPDVGTKMSVIAAA
ncbi:hypothetical protein [Pyruvatibacter mobilis]|uniref:hypothetical protein n=1 Tax=Pyruvatibacter mobilis TaxID=1712261 RepID=UPI003BAC592B